MSKSRTTAGELIAMLSELDPDTHVFVDIGWHDWGHSDAIELIPVEDESVIDGKTGAVHLCGLDEWDVKRANTIQGETL